MKEDQNRLPDIEESDHRPKNIEENDNRQKSNAKIECWPVDSHYLDLKKMPLKILKGILLHL